MRISKNFTTHMPMLIKTVQASSGPVMELGGGMFSTPLLHWLCHETGRTLITYESNFEYFRALRNFQSKNHRIRFIESWDDIDLKTFWSVILIDHVAERRKIDALKFKNNADYIVIHDTQETEYYGYDDEFWSNFKYRYDWKNTTPNTSVISNFKNIKV